MANGIQAELLVVCVVPTMASKSSVMELWKCVKPQSSQTRLADQMPQNQPANASSQTQTVSRSRLEPANITTDSTISGGVHANPQAMKYGTNCDNEQGRSLDLSGGSSTSLKGPSSSVELGWKERP